MFIRLFKRVLILLNNIIENFSQKLGFEQNINTILLAEKSAFLIASLIFPYSRDYYLILAWTFRKFSTVNSVSFQINEIRKK